ncbi:MAG: TraB/GumN family protein [Candidatus Binatia bacterium]
MRQAQWFCAMLALGVLLVFISSALAQQLREDEQGTLYYDNQAPGDAEREISSPSPPARRTPSVSRSPARSFSTFTTGLLWRIDSPLAGARRVQPSYIFGTMHSGDPRILKLTTTVEPTLKKSDSFCMELLATPAAVATLSQSLLYTNGQTLSSVIGNDLFRKLVPLMNAHGIPEPMLTLFKPWAVIMGLSAPPQEQASLSLDFALHNIAKQSGKQVCGIETVEEQISVFEEIPLADQIAILRDLTKGEQPLERLTQQREQLAARYLARDLSGLLSLSYDLTADDPNGRRILTQFLRRLTDKRNVRMVERLVPRLQQESVFIAVGALHLPGKNGILQMLADRGYAVSVMY